MQIDGLFLEAVLWCISVSSYILIVPQLRNQETFRVKLEQQSLVNLKPGDRRQPVSQTHLKLSIHQRTWVLLLPKGWRCPHQEIQDVNQGCLLDENWCCVRPEMVWNQDLLQVQAIWVRTWRNRGSFQLSAIQSPYGHLDAKAISRNKALFCQETLGAGQRLGSICWP